MELKFALRSFRRTPGFTLFSILIFALGIGVNTAIFSVVNSVVLRPLSYNDPGRLVAITHAWRGGSNYSRVSGPDFLDYQSQTNTFESMAAYSDDLFNVTAGGKPEFVGGAAVSRDFLRTLGVSPIAGRAFVPSDFTGKPAVALVGGSFWQRHFGNIPFDTGRTLKTSGVSLEIIGILPSQFRFPENSATEVWAPLFESLSDTARSSGNFHAVGRLKPAVSLVQAQEQLNVISRRLQRAYPDSNDGKTAYLSTLTNYTVRNVKTSLYLLMGAVALVFLIACANLANLFLTRALGRTRELAIRAAVGATQARLVRQLVVETSLLGIGGCLAGTLLAQALLPALLSLAPKYVPRLGEVRIDAFALLVCSGAGLLLLLCFGLVPAFYAARVDPSRDLRGGGARGVLGGAAARVRQALVAAEIALCLILLVSAGLLLQSFSALTAVSLGFAPERLLIATMSVPAGTGEQALRRVFHPLLEQASSLPQVQSAALTVNTPMEPDGRSNGAYIVTGQSMKDFTVNAPEAGFSVSSAGYFRTLGLHVIAGRTFNENDRAGSPAVVIINQQLGRVSFGNADPVGKKLLCGYDQASFQWMTIVGVVSNARFDNPKQHFGPEIFLPIAQHANTFVNLLVRATGDPMSLTKTIAERTRSLDSETSVQFTTVERNLANAVATPLFSSTLVTAFAILALLLAGVGIYAVVSYSVAQRTSEVGLRMAVGAGRSDVLRMILGESLRLIAAGLALGTVVAVVSAHLIRSQLFGVSPQSPTTYAVTILVLISAALIAGCVPAYRASQIEPLTALRQE